MILGLAYPGYTDVSDGGLTTAIEVEAEIEVLEFDAEIELDLEGV